MRARPLSALTAVLVLVLAGCFGGGSETNDQALVPAESPGDWIEQELAGVTFASPATWDELDLPDPKPGTARVGFAGPPSSSGSTGGILVMVIPEPNFPARNQAQTFINNAQSREQASGSELDEVTWPGAEQAWFATYTAQVGDEPHPTMNLVLDFENGYQVQATVRAQKGTPEAADLREALASVRVKDEPLISDAA